MKDNDINWWYFENSILKYKYHRGAGGAMALKLNGISDTTIKKGGRWTFMDFCNISITKSVTYRQGCPKR